MKAIYESLHQGPIPVKILAVYSRVDGQPLEVIVKVTCRDNALYRRGELLVIQPLYLWLGHRYVGYKSLYEGHPDCSELPDADAELRKALYADHVVTHLP